MERLRSIVRVVTTPPKERPAAPSARPRGRPPRVGRDDVIESAAELFARRGYRNTTLAAIAKSIGVTDASVLHYFDTKLAILEAVLSRDEEPGNVEFLDLIEPGGLQALRQLSGWGAVMEKNVQSTRLLIVLSAEALSEGSELHGRFEQRYRYVRRRLIAAIQRGVDAGEIRADVDAEHEATSVLAFLDGLRLQWFYANGDLSLEDHLRAFVEHMIERIAAGGSRRRVRSRRA